MKSLTKSSKSLMIVAFSLLKGEFRSPEPWQQPGRALIPVT